MKIRCLIFCLFLFAIPAHAQTDTSRDSGNWHLSIGLGVSDWSKLEALQTMQGARFDKQGLALEMAAHFRATSWHGHQVLVGADLGFFSAESNIVGRYIPLTQRGIYLTPSVKVLLGERGRFRFETGAGWYNTDFAEVDCNSGYACGELNVPYNASAIGGYVGIAARFSKYGYVNLRSHFVDFGAVDIPRFDGQSLDGPILLAMVGVSF